MIWDKGPVCPVADLGADAVRLAVPVRSYGVRWLRAQRLGRRTREDLDPGRGQIGR